MSGNINFSPQWTPWHKMSGSICIVVMSSMLLVATKLLESCFSVNAREQHTCSVHVTWQGRTPGKGAPPPGPLIDTLFEPARQVAHLHRSATAPITIAVAARAGDLCCCRAAQSMQAAHLTCSCLTTRPFSGRQLPASRCNSQRPSRRQIASRRRVQAGIQLDFADPDTLTGLAAAVLGLGVGIGAPLFYISRDDKDEERLADLRELNRQHYKETGKYLTEVSIRSLLLAGQVKSSYSCLQNISCCAGRNKSYSHTAVD